MSVERISLVTPVSAETDYNYEMEVIDNVICTVGT
jgi:hypothetical protein